MVENEALQVPVVTVFAAIVARLKLPGDTSTAHRSPASLQHNRWCKAPLFFFPHSHLGYYSLLGCLPMARVNRSCPCWCTLLFGVQTKVTNTLKSKKGHYLLLLMRGGIHLFTTTLCVPPHESRLTEEWWMALDTRRTWWNVARTNNMVGISRYWNAGSLIYIQAVLHTRWLKWVRSKKKKKWLLASYHCNMLVIIFWIANTGAKGQNMKCSGHIAVRYLEMLLIPENKSDIWKHLPLHSPHRHLFIFFSWVMPCHMPLCAG